MMSAGTLEMLLDSGCRELGINLTDKALDDFRKYYELLRERNRHTNLTTINGETDVAQRHFLDSAVLIKYGEFSGASVLDVGSGAGFPGLVLRILIPSIKLTLVDSNNKKTAFLTDV
jgi:16S rRNA (guanine527-N7)-methyltransferase